MDGLIGKKLGMTQVYDADGQRVAVTVLEAGPCVVTQCKTRERDGYAGVQLGFGEQKESRLSKAVATHIKKAGASARRVLREFRPDEGEAVSPGDAVTVSLFAGATHVDVTAVSKGKGFAGVVRRFRMAGGPKTHGGHSKRRIGSIGQRTWPSRVMKGRHMPGQMGNTQVTTQNLKLVRIDADRNVLLVGGAVPGPNGGVVLIRRALKKPLDKAAK